MQKEVDLLAMAQTVLATFDNRQSFSPGMFEPLKPLFRKFGYESVAIYICDDYPDRMQKVTGYGGEAWFPEYVAINRRSSLMEEFRAATRGVPGLMSARLFNHGRELGVLAATCSTHDEKTTKDAFRLMAKSLSIMAYVERIRTNDLREREERDVFFAQSLTNRLLIREAPRIKGLRLGFQFTRSLEAGGDFFDLMPSRNGGVLGFIGCCNGYGLRTVLEVTAILREIYRSLPAAASLAETIGQVNHLLVREKQRAHQASLCLFEVDVKKHTLTLAKAGRLGLLIAGPDAGVTNISAAGGMFLGMTANPKIKDEVHDFHPGQSLFSVTEGFYNSRNCLNAKPQIHWFLRAVEATLESKPKIPLANAVFENVDSAADYVTYPAESMLAVSVEFLGK